MSKSIQRFIRDEDGMTAVEYALIAGMLALAIVTSASLLGDRVGGAFTAVSNILG